jgi:hypothetical protein
MDLYLTEPVGPFHTAGGSAFNTFTTKKDVSPSPLPVIPAGKLRLGSKILIRANGEYSTTGTPTLAWGLWFGTRAASITGDIALSSVITTPSASAAFPWMLEWEGICNAVGTSGTLLGQGTLVQGTSLTATSTFPIPITQALRTVSSFDTTIERAIGVSATWGTSNASNSITTYALTVMIIN